MALHQLAITAVVYDDVAAIITVTAEGGVKPKPPSTVDADNFFMLGPPQSVSFDVSVKKKQVASSDAVAVVTLADGSIGYRRWSWNGTVWTDMGPCNDRGELLAVASSTDTTTTPTT